MFKLVLEKAEEPEIKLPTYARSSKKQESSRKKHLFLLYWLCRSLWLCAAAAAKLLQSCLTLCDPTDGSPLGSPVPGILQARTLERVAISFSNAWKWKVKVKSLSRVRLLGTPWTAAYQAPLSMGLSRQEYWSGVPLPSPLTVWIKTNWKILKEMGIPDHLTCLLRNLYAGQEATVRTGHGTRLVPNRERSMSRLNIVTLLIELICRVHHEKCWTGWSTSWKSILMGEISITSDMQMTPPLRQKVKKN